MPKLNTSFSPSQRGISLIESLVAILVMSLGILGVLGMQMRTLADTQTGVRRAQAIRLIEDLSERMKINPNALINISNYTTAWADEPTVVEDCTTKACTPAELALFDVADWKTSVRNYLPLGQASIFVAADETDADNRRQLGVMIAWRENEQPSTSDDGLRSIFDPDSTGDANVSCPSGSICHLQYLQLTARCTPYGLSGADTTFVFCPMSRSDLLQ